MAFATSFVRHTLLWDLPGGEKASCRVHWTGGGGILTLSGLMTPFAARATAFWTAQKSAHPTDCLFVGSRLQLISVANKVIETQEAIVAGVPGTGTGVSLPSEVSVAASLRTNTYSRSGRGRIYLPPMDVSRVVAGGRFYQPTRDSTATNLVAYLQDLTVGAATFEPVIASVTQQELRVITEVRVGDVFDAQRRRRDSLVESYKVLAV